MFNHTKIYDKCLAVEIICLLEFISCMNCIYKHVQIHRCTEKGCTTEIYFYLIFYEFGVIVCDLRKLIK